MKRASTLLAGILVVTSATAIVSPAVAQSTVTIGSATDGNCFPFSCFASVRGIGAIYQQVYAAGSFGTGNTFNNISFGFNQGGILDSATYDVKFYATSALPNALSNNPVDNRGMLLSNFGTFSLGGATANTLSLTGATTAYSPALGDLLLDVTVTGYTASGGYSAFLNSGSDQNTSRLYGNATGGYSTDGLGVQTTFSSVAGAVPEPATWAMMLLGFGMVGFGMRYRRNSQIAKVSFA